MTEIQAGQRPSAMRATLGAISPLHIGLLLVVALCPLPLGSNRPWSWSLVAVCVAALLLVWAIRQTRRRQPPPVPMRWLAPVVVLFLLPIGWAACQTLTMWPASWDHPIWVAAATTGLPITAGRISVDPGATNVGIMRLMTYGAVFWLALQTCRPRDAAQQLSLAVLVAAGGLYSLYGVVAELVLPGTILWFDKWAYPDSATSTFVNRNNFATYAGLTALAALTQFAHAVFRHVGRSDQSRAEVIKVFENLAKPRSWLALLVLFVSLTALLLTDSRGGMAAGLVGILVLILALRACEVIPRSFSRVSIGVVAIALAVTFLASAGETVDRISGAIIDDARWGLFDLSARAIAAAPLLGYGLGTYPHVFQAFRTPDMIEGYTKAHNTYLELAVELGVPAAACLVLAVGGLGLLCLIGMRRRRRDLIYPCVGLAATALVAVHSLVDFSMQIPAIAVTYAFIMGLACSQCWSTRTG